MSVRIINGDCRAVLASLPDASVQCCVTSPPYWGLRDYGTATWEGGDADCQHQGDARYYTEKTAGSSSAGAFSQAGAANAARLKEGRWREGGSCVKCGARHADAQIGLEQSPDAYVAEMVAVFREVRRMLRDDGTLWLNIGDSYNSIGHKKSHSGYGTTGLAGGKAQEHTPLRRENTDPTLKHKDLCMIPARVALALQADGWWLRSDIIWHKPNPMPESVLDRPTSAHEHMFLLTKAARYFYDADAVREPSEYPDDDRKSRSAITDKRMPGGKIAGIRPGAATYPTRNLRNVWTITTAPFAEAHFATFPPEIAERCIKAGSKPGDTILDPFGGAGTTGLVADRLGRSAVLIELNATYADMARSRIAKDGGMFAEVA